MDQIADSAGSDQRHLGIDSALGKGALLLVGMQGEEGLSQLFSFSLEVISPLPSIKPEALIGTAVSWRVADQTGTPRHFHGIVRAFECRGVVEEDRRAYRLEVVPWLWLLSQTTDCRIFQRQSARDIIRTVLDENRANAAVQFDLSHIRGAADVREYCVQYRESDFAFISRLAEDEGLFYYFRHEAGRHVLVMADQPAAYFDLPDPKLELTHTDQDWGGISQWTATYSLQPASWVQRDFNFETPRADLTGSCNSVLPRMGGTPLERFDYPGGHADRAAGTVRAKLRMEELEGGFAVATGAGGYRHMAPGGRFTPIGATEATAAQVAVWVRHSVGGPGQRSDGAAARYVNSFVCRPAGTPFRPARTTPRPVVAGLQTAIVVGPAGEEVACDKHGRVRVQFHWDRLGQRNENSSCWIRVAQAWAGRGWGQQYIPRIGNEVVVSFLEGDPDRPLIVGSVYNGDNPTPFGLADHKTQSGLKTRSSKDGGQADFNELRFEDRKGSEEVYVHAQKNLRRVVENDDRLEVGHDRTSVIQHDRTETIKKGDRAVTIELGSDSLTIKTGDQTTKLALGKSLHEAMQSIELKVGQSSIRLDQTGVSIKGMVIMLEAQGFAHVTAPMTNVNADGILTIRGGLVMIN